MIIWHLIVRALTATVIATLALGLLPTAADASARTTSLTTAQVAGDGDRHGNTTYWYYDARLDTGAPTRLGRGGTTSPWETPWPPTWPDELTTGASCEVACIKAGKAHDYGPGSTTYINVWTTTPVYWYLVVTNEELDFSSSRANYNTMATQAHASYPELEPGTTYHATIRVEDAWGNIEEASGWFTTSG